MSEHEVCPGCAASLVGDRIPADIVEHYIPWGEDKDEWLANNPWPTWKRKVGIEVRGIYDGVLIWECPDCNHRWPRFPEEDTRHRKALDIIKKWGDC